MTLAADPASLQERGRGGDSRCRPRRPRYLGEDTQLEVTQAKVAAGAEPDAAAAEFAGAIKEKGGKVPSWAPGAPAARPAAERILEHRRARRGQPRALARSFRDAVADAWGKPLTMNVAMPIAAVLLDLGFVAAIVKAIPILARTAGLLAHLAEEQENPIGFLLAAAAEDA